MESENQQVIPKLTCIKLSFSDKKSDFLPILSIGFHVNQFPSLSKVS